MGIFENYFDLVLYVFKDHLEPSTRSLIYMERITTHGKKIGGNVVSDFLGAIKAGNISLVRELLQKNPRLATVTDKRGVSAILLALYHQNEELVQTLLPYVTEFSIFEAAALGYRDVVAQIIKNNTKLANDVSNDGFGPLGLAVFFGHYHTAEYLIELGADVNRPSSNKMRVRPLQSAAANKDKALALRLSERLIKAGADVNVSQDGGWTPLHQAAAHGNIELVRMLLRYGANPNARAEDGRIPQDMVPDKMDELKKLLKPRKRGT